MSSIQQREEQLFAEWETQLRLKKHRSEADYEHADAFYRDGVVDPKHYESASVRVVLALREANFKSKDNTVEYKSYNLRDEIPRDPQKFWTHKVAPWCVGFQKWEDPTTSMSIEEIWTKASAIRFDREERSKCLARYGYVQLKKIPGGAKINPKQFAAFVTNERAFLRRQFEIYQPDIIVACGISFPRTFDLLTGEIFPEARDCARDANFQRRCARVQAGKSDCNSTFIIETMHPSHLRDPKKVFFQLMCDYRQAVALLRQPRSSSMGATTI